MPRWTVWVTSPSYLMVTCAVAGSLHAVDRTAPVPGAVGQASALSLVLSPLGSSARRAAPDEDVPHTDLRGPVLHRISNLSPGASGTAPSGYDNRLL